MVSYLFIAQLLAPLRDLTTLRAHVVKMVPQSDLDMGGVVSGAQQMWSKFKLVRDSAESSLALSGTAHSEAWLCPGQHGVKLSAVGDSTESSLALSGTAWSQA